MRFFSKPVVNAQVCFSTRGLLPFVTRLPAWLWLAYAAIAHTDARGHAAKIWHKAPRALRLRGKRYTVSWYDFLYC